MSDSSQDIALNHALCAYETGRVNRQQRLCIRFQPAPNSTKASLETLEIFETDATTAGHHWEPQELDTEDIPKEWLAIVVGEMLPLDIVKAKYQEPESDEESGRGKSKAISVNLKARLVVRPLANQKSNLMLLNNRQPNGLCLINKLPQSSEVKKRTFIYSEWSWPSEMTTQKQRVAWVSNALNNYCESMGRQLDDENIIIASQQACKSSHQWRIELDPGEILSSRVFKAGSMYAATKDPTWLATAMDETREAQADARSRPNLPVRTEDEAEKLRYATLRDFMSRKEPISLEEAVVVAKTCQVSSIYASTSLTCVLT